MLRRTIIVGLTMSLIVIVCATAVMLAVADDVRVANAAMKGDKAAVRGLIKQAVDVNAAQGDGMTALHWAALNNDAEMAQLLLYAGANTRATTRIGGYSALFMAAKSGSSSVVDLLLKSGADPKAKASDGLTPLMMASMAGDRESARLLLDRGADANAKETENGQTALIFAAAFDRPAVIEELAKHGADLNLATSVRQPPPPPVRGQPQGNGQTPAANQQPQGGRAAAAANATPAPTPAATTQQPAQQAAQLPPQMDQGARGGGNAKGGLTALMYTARDGNLAAAKALVANSAKLDALSADRSSALLLATINGKFDVAKYLVEQGADVNIASVDGAAPLYGVVHTQWSRESFHPQPSIKLEQTSYLDLMKMLLDQGADPNARLTKTLWYSSYGYVYEASSEIGTTSFWRCAGVGDLDGMKLLLSRGADAHIANKDGVTALLNASGAGQHGNDEVTAPAGRFAAVRYLIEELHFDVNASDNGTTLRGEFVQQTPPAPAPANNAAAGTQQPPQPQPQQNFGGMSGAGFTALHNAAARGDNEMILYLVSKGAKVDAVTKTGVTVVDMANGPRQRVQPYPETIALLEMLGAKNSHKCVSC